MRWYGSLQWLVVIVLVAYITRTSGQTIAAVYAATNASRLVIAPGAPYIVKTFFSGTNTTTLEIYSTYRFDGNSTTFADGAIFVPSRVTIPIPYCAPIPFRIIAEQPPSCAGGQLIYGAYTIAANNALVPNSSVYINGPVMDSLIQGLSVFGTDPGSDTNWSGTLTWLPPPGCPTSMPSPTDFKITLAAQGMFDVADSSPLEYVDSKSNTSLWANVQGLACSAARRASLSPGVVIEPVFVPICKGYVPIDYPGLNTTLYSLMFGTGFIGPTNVPNNGIAYQLRVNNLDQAWLVQADIFFLYVDGSEDDYNPIFASFDNVQYLITKGTLPAFSFGCFFDIGCQVINFYNEAELGFLQPCNCQPLGGNIPCFANNSLITTGVNRTSLPNFDASVVFVSTPTCAFFINPSQNGSSPIMQTDFQIVSTAFGGSGPILYNWDLTNTPPSAGIIFPPTTTSVVTARIMAPGSYTVRLTVYNANEPFVSCNQTFEVLAGGPTACMSIPLQFSVPPFAQFAVDGACSFNPFGTPLIYMWTIQTLMALDPFVISSTTGPGIIVTAPASGFAQLILVVQNEAGLGQTASTITVVVDAPLPPAIGPISPSIVPTPVPFSCYVPSPPEFIPFVVPQVLPPLIVVPMGPSPPLNVNPNFNPSLGPGGVLSPTAENLQNAFIAIFAAAGVFVVFIIGIYIYQFFRKQTPKTDKTV